VPSQSPSRPDVHPRREPTTKPSGVGHGQQVAVVGGSGFYGRYLVADLLRFTAARVLVVSRRAPQRLRPTDRVVPIACDLRDPHAPRRHRDVPSESMRYGLGFWLHESLDVVMLEGSDAGVSFRTVHDRVGQFTHTVLPNTTSGAWPITRHLEQLLTP
jgi:hypothetical protein